MGSKLPKGPRAGARVKASSRTRPAGLRWARWYWTLGFAYIGVILFLTLTSAPPAGPDLPYADKWEHMLAYGVLMGWFGQLLHGRTRRIQWALAFVAMGGGLELLQGLGGVRHAEWADFAANATGVAIGYFVSGGPLGGGLHRFERFFMDRFRSR